MGGPAGSVWDGNPDADLGSLYSFLDVQHMRGGRASSFLWKYYCDVGDCAVSSWNFHPEAKKNRKKSTRLSRKHFRDWNLQTEMA